MAAEPKTKRTKESVAAFLAAIEDEQKRKDAKAIAKMMADVTGEKPAMWGTAIVGFGSYKAGANDWPLIGFSPRKANLTLYVKSGAVGTEALMAKLGKHKAGKGCVYISRLSDVDESALRALMASTVKYMKAKFA
jgi:hypothetical protein